jgi:hypothetical protein
MIKEQHQAVVISANVNKDSERGVKVSFVNFSRVSAEGQSSRYTTIIYILTLFVLGLKTHSKTSPMFTIYKDRG